MDIKREAVLKAVRKEATIKYLESVPEHTRFAPSDACGCMYHSLLMAEFDIRHGDDVNVGIDDIEINGVEFSVRRTFASRFQARAINFVRQFRAEQRINRLNERAYLTISRDEAIEIAKGIAA